MALPGGKSPKTVLLLGAKIVASLALFVFLYRRVDWVNAETTIAHAHEKRSADGLHDIVCIDSAPYPQSLDDYITVNAAEGFPDA